VERGKVAIIATQGGKSYFISDYEKKIAAAVNLEKEFQHYDKNRIPALLEKLHSLLSENSAVNKRDHQDETTMPPFDYDSVAFALIYGQGTINTSDLKFFKSSQSAEFFSRLQSSVFKHLHVFQEGVGKASSIGEIMNEPGNYDFIHSGTMMGLALGLIVLLGGGLVFFIYMHRRKHASVERSAEDEFDVKVLKT
jgi:hypothetical protein